MTSVVEGFVAGDRYEIEFPDGMEEAQRTRATQEFFESIPLMGVRGSSSDLFTMASQFTFKNEGGFSNDPDDPGGKTKFGVSQRAFPGIDIEGLTLQEAGDIYRKEFWQRPGIDKIPYDNLAIKTFDAGVNMGSQAASKLLQRALNDIGASPDDENKRRIQVDGRLGPSTLSAIARADEDKLTQAFIKRLKKRYGEIVAANPRSSKFLRGWIKRAERRPDAE
jgi:lysozyme family protein